ncbi:hypothetical protein M0805_003493 [Coniferiporia weirii]|nr:hypothetical protein M0805_003493 [Coniferiporia weirii]
MALLTWSLPFSSPSTKGTSLLAQIIAAHTFNVLFLNNNTRRSVMYIVLFGGWCFIGIVVGIGPSFLATRDRGPFFSISGYWCWISGSYEVGEIVLDYMLMFASAFFSFSMYMLVFLRLRGNIVISPGKRIGIRTVCRETAWASAQGRETSDFQRQMTSTAKHMLLYPIAYTFLIVPIAAVRFSEWMGHEVPLGAVIFSDSIFLLSGLVNAILFVTTGRVLSYAKIRAIFGKPESVNMVEASAEKCWDGEVTAMTSVISDFVAPRSACDIEKDLPPVPVHVIFTRDSHREVTFFPLTPRP